MRVAQTIEGLDTWSNGITEVEIIVEEYRLNSSNARDIVAVGYILNLIKFNSYAEKMLAEKMLIMGLAIADKANKT